MSKGRNQTISAANSESRVNPVSGINRVTAPFLAIRMFSDGAFFLERDSSPMKRCLKIILKLILKITMIILPAIAVIGYHWAWCLQFGSELADRPPLTVSKGSFEFDVSTKRYLPKLEEFGKELPKAIVASEDIRFWSRDSAFDPHSIGGIAKTFFMTGKLRGGRSIGSQLSAIEYPEIKAPEGKDGFRGTIALFSRKILEVGFGTRAIATRGHNGVLEDYMRRAPLPGMGVESTCWRAFGKASSELAADEAVAIAALLPNPSSRLKNNSLWSDAAAARGTATGVPSMRSGWYHPFGSVYSLKSPEAAHIDRELQLALFQECSRVAERGFVRDCGGLVLDPNLQIVAVVDSARPGVVRPWPTSTLGVIRLNSIIKAFIAAEIARSGGDLKKLERALAVSDSEYFCDWAHIIGETSIQKRLDMCGMTPRVGFSAKGRMWVSPIVLARSFAVLSKEVPETGRLLRGVLRYGSAASASRHWPELPDEETFAKTGTGPESANMLICGQYRGFTILIWEFSEETQELEAGEVLGVPFSEIVMKLKQSIK